MEHFLKYLFHRLKGNYETQSICCVWQDCTGPCHDIRAQGTLCKAKSEPNCFYLITAWKEEKIPKPDISLGISFGQPPAPWEEQSILHYYPALSLQLSHKFVWAEWQHTSHALSCLHPWNFKHGTLIFKTGNFSIFFSCILLLQLFFLFCHSLPALFSWQFIFVKIKKQEQKLLQLCTNKHRGFTFVKFGKIKSQTSSLKFRVH